MLHILTIVIRKVIHDYIRSLKYLNIDAQQEYISQKELNLVII